MRRKIAAILVAHIADYGRLVAEDEEQTLRRMASCRTTTDDFIAVAGGRIFNTAGDAVLAEFPSAVEAVRCAIDIQESLRTRNLAYPGSRQLSYRIGIGDVVERDGDLLGDGVNIAARLEGLAEIGGICISRAVQEQVAGKLSARFIDIGARQVKNIPQPVHAYIVVTWDDSRSSEASQAAAVPAGARSARKLIAVALIGAFMLCTGALALFLANQKPDGKASPGPTAAAAMPPVPTIAPQASPSTSPLPPASSSPATLPSPPASSSPAKPAAPAPVIIRRTSSSTSETDAPRRSFEACSAIAAQRGWKGTGHDMMNGQSAFMTACMQGRE
jgi:adenylate cyclase